jgi:predicted CopG family antitoxin
MHMIICMKTITINVSEPVYEDFQQYARKTDRKASELIREAMELYREQHMRRRTSLKDRRPISVGGPIRPITAEDDVLEGMLDDARD